MRREKTQDENIVNITEAGRSRSVTNCTYLNLSKQPTKHLASKVINVLVRS